MNSTTILVIDDDTVTRKTLTRVLTQQDYRVIEAADGRQGITLYQTEHPELIFLDVMMPVMDGYEACRILRQTTNANELPIIMLTGLDDIDSVKLAFECGATDFITKPINWPLLSQRLRYALRTKSLYAALTKNQNQLIQAQRIAKLGYYEYNLRSKMMQCSKEMLDLLGFPPNQNELHFQNYLSSIPAPDRDTVNNAFLTAKNTRQPVRFDHRVKRPNGSVLIIHEQGELLSTDSGQEIFSVTIQDVTERKNAESVLEYQKNYDSLTRLPNEFHFQKSLKDAIVESDLHHTLLAVALVKPDRFREINDTLGASIGNELLRLIALRVKMFSTNDLIVSRYQGSTFALLYKNLKNTDHLEKELRDIRDRLNSPYKIGEYELHQTFSIGAMRYPLDGNGMELLIAGAQTTVSHLKKKGGNGFSFYAKDHAAKTGKKLAIERDLRKAIKSHSLDIHYQPQVKSTTRTIAGVEALVRWTHPEHGQISPLEFIPVAEETGLIIELGSYVLNKACLQIRDWQQLGFAPVRVGVNFSTRQFLGGNVVETIKQAISLAQIDPALLDVEITESLALENADNALATLHAIRALGAHLSIDDFGTGYSSLSYLHKLPVTTVKIDRAFIKDIGPNGERGEIAKAIIAMAHSLGLSVIAEGVETQHHVEFLTQQGCEELQGFYFSRPAPASEIEKLFWILKDKAA